MDQVIKKGDIVTTIDNRQRTVKKIDGRFIYFTDGSVYGLSHPDIVEIKSEKKKKDKKSDSEE